MASPEYYQEGKTEGGFWRFLALGLTIGVAVFLLIDKVNIGMASS